MLKLIIGLIQKEMCETVGEVEVNKEEVKSSLKFVSEHDRIS
jgi:hypothetical protein